MGPGPSFMAVPSQEVGAQYCTPVLTNPEVFWPGGVTVPCRKASRPPQDPRQPHDHGLRLAHNTGASMNNGMVAFWHSCMCMCMGASLHHSSERCNNGPSISTLCIGKFPFSFFLFTKPGWVPILPVDGMKGEGRVHVFFLGQQV